MGTAAKALRASLRIEGHSITPIKGLITALPVVGVFAVALSVSSTSVAIAMAIGANLVAIVSLVGAPKLSLRLAAVDALGLGLSVVVGAATAAVPVLHDALLAPWCFLAALAVVFGLTQGIIGSQIVVAYIVLGRQPASFVHALTQGGLVTLGASVEILALLLLRLPASLRFQRTTLATALTAVADYAEASPDQSALAALAAVDEAQRVLSPSSLFGRSDVRDLRAIVDQIRRSRLELTAIAGLRGRLREVAPATLTVALDDALRAYAVALRDIAEEIRHPLRNPTTPPQNMRVRLDLVSQLLESAENDATATLTRQCLTHLESLRGQLRSCRDLARSERRDDGRRGLTRDASATASRTWRDRLELLREHLHRDDVAFRHAVRYSVAVVASSVLVSFWHLPRGYWVPFSVAVILKPDYSTLLRRGVSRVVGTALGASLAAVLVAELHPTHVETIILVGLVAAAAYATWAASFAVSIGLVSSLVLIMLSTATHDSLSTAGDRFVDVALGAAIAASTYLLWPSSQHSDVLDAEAALRSTIATYVDAVFTTLLDASPRIEVAKASRAAHFAYSRAEVSIGRSLDEPAATRVDPSHSRSVLVTSLRLLRALHTLRLGERPGALPDNVAALRTFRDCVRDALSANPQLDRHAVRRAFVVIEQAWPNDASSDPFVLTLDEIANTVDTLRSLTQEASAL